jgi:PXA domain
VAYRQLLVHAVLALLLPTEDLENECLTALVGQIFSELIIGNNIASKLSEPWFIWECLIISSRTIGRRRAAGGEGAPRSSSKALSDGRRTFSIQALFWTMLQWCFLATSFIRVAFTILVTSRSLPPRAFRGGGTREGVVRHKAGAESEMEPTPLADSSEVDSEPLKTAVLAFRCWPAISNLIEMDARMPWLCGALSILQWIAMTGPGRMAGVDGIIDR